MNVVRGDVQAVGVREEGTGDRMKSRRLICCGDPSSGAVAVVGKYEDLCSSQHRVSHLRLGLVSLSEHCDWLETLLVRVFSKGLFWEGWA